MPYMARRRTPVPPPHRVRLTRPARAISAASRAQPNLRGSGQLRHRRKPSHRLLSVVNNPQNRTDRCEQRDCTECVARDRRVYLDALRPSASLAQNILRVILALDGLLREEPRFLFAQHSDLRDQNVHFSIMRAIAAGRTRRGEIAERVGRADSATGQLLDRLIEMGLLRRVHPVTVANPDRTRLVRGLHREAAPSRRARPSHLPRGDQRAAGRAWGFAKLGGGLEHACLRRRWGIQKEDSFRAEPILKTKHETDAARPAPLERAPAHFAGV